VIIASVVGAAFILISLLYFQPQIFDIAAKELYTTMTIEGLKDTYKVGESIDFIVRVEGYGCDKGFPSVAIYNVSTKEMVWSRFGEFRLFPAGYSCPHEYIHNVRHVGDLEKYNNDEQERLRTKGGVPIVMNDEGRYAVDVESTVKEFMVVAG
jgi:hypothetical protein